MNFLHFAHVPALCCALAFCALASLPQALQAQQAKRTNEKLWEKAVVTIEVTRKNYDYLRPWSKSSRSIQKAGVVVGPKEILTTAEDLNDLTLARIQKGGRGKFYAAKVTWVDYHANLAIVTSDEAPLWTDLKPVVFADPVPTTAPMEIVRWRNGNLEIRRAEFTQFSVDDAKLTYIQHLQMDVSSEMAGAGWGEPLVSGGKVVGLVFAHTGNTCNILISPFINNILQARKKGQYRGLGYFDFVWQPAQNPAISRFFKVPGEPRGAIVIEVPKRATNPSPLKQHDMLLQVDGFDIDNEGYYRDPQYGNLILESLATRNHWAGDKIKMKIWRDGQAMDILFELPKVDYSAQLLPHNTFDKEPEYLVAGGLVFQPLTRPYLRTWGNDWKRNAPFRLSYYDGEHPTPERPSIVVISTILPDPYNLGYQDSRYLIVDQINGRKISRLNDVLEAFKTPKDGFHTLEFMKGDSLQKMVLDAEDLAGATRRVLQRYGIDKPHVISGVGG